MNRATKTRTQRRMEKRLAVLLLVIALGIALISFALGVMVGRRGAEREFAKQEQNRPPVVVQTPVVQAPVVQAPVEQEPPVVAESVVSAPENDKQVEAAPLPDQVAAEKDPQLSFYKGLEKQAAPLGSGINVPPPPPQPAAPVVSKPPIDLPQEPIVKKSAAEAAKPVAAAARPAQAKAETEPQKTVAALPPAVKGGGYSVQVGSFNSTVDAMALKKRIEDKNYPAFIAEADLGAKGLWYRVRVGPYPDSSQAKQVQQVLERNDGLKGFISKQ